jgi:hypothetical protein
MHTQRYDDRVGAITRACTQFALPCLLLFTAACSNALANETFTDRIKPFGDFRVRLEQDWDSLQGDGTKRDDRLRLRIRLRAGLDFKINKHWNALVSVRTGPHKSQQSPHITVYDFDGGPEGPYEANFDRWFLKYKNKGFHAWVGRNELSFWHQDDLFVFDNITYPGVGVGYDYKFGPGILTSHLNYVALPAGMLDTAGTGVIGQLAWNQKISEQSGFRVSTSVSLTNADPDEPAGDILLTDNNKRDYSIGELAAEYRTRAFGKRLLFGGNVARNFKNYDNAQPGSFSAFHKNDVDKVVVEVNWGEMGRPGDWLFAYYYAYIEALGMHSSYISDDWVRWGDAYQVRGTNLKGSEFRARYTIRLNQNILARLFFVDAINLLEPGDTTKETGNRFRVDYNIAF